MINRSLIMATMGLALLGQLTTLPPIAPTWPKVLLWNASASVPRGLYLLRPARPLHVGELVSVTPPTALADFMAARGYLSFSTPLLKHIAALGGKTVCRGARSIAIDGRVIAVARERDARGRLLPSWQGCLRLGADDVFLLNPTVPDSFDGRYFGALSFDAITARAEPLWTFPRR